MFFRPKRLLIVKYVNTTYTYSLNALKSLLIKPGSELLRLRVVCLIFFYLFLLKTCFHSKTIRRDLSIEKFNTGLGRLNLGVRTYIIETSLIL